MKEVTIHPIVKDFLINEKKCIDARINLGHQYVGKADVFGIKDIGGIYNSNMIGYAVEVKLERAPFGKNVGQALGYSLFSHRCYFAVPSDDPFDDEDIEMANRLGIGLIQIDIENKDCTEILTAQHHEPIEGLFLTVADVLGYSQCTSCKEFFVHGKETSRRPPSTTAKTGRHFYYRMEKDNVFFTKSKKRWPVIICNTCLKTLEYHKKGD